MLGGGGALVEQREHRVVDMSLLVELGVDAFSNDHFLLLRGLLGVYELLEQLAVSPENGLLFQEASSERAACLVEEVVDGEALLLSAQALD